MVLCFHYCNGQICPIYDIASDYVQVFSLLPDPIMDNYAKIAINNCLFGKEQNHVNRDYCLYHCFLREDCVAVYMGNNGECRLCYDGTLSANYDEFDHEHMFIRLQVLGESDIQYN